MTSQESLLYDRNNGDVEFELTISIVNPRTKDRITRLFDLSLPSAE